MEKKNPKPVPIEEKNRGDDAFVVSMLILDGEVDENLNDDEHEFDFDFDIDM